MSNGQYVGAGSSVTKLLLHLNNDVIDASGNGYNGTATSITYEAGEIAQYSATFNGTTSKITCPLTSTSFLTKTIAVWLKCSNTASFYTICQQRRYASAINYNFWSIELNTGKIKYQEYDNTGTGDEYITTTTYPTTKWFNLVVTLSGNVYKFYINGSLVESYTTGQRATTFTPDLFNVGVASNFTTSQGFYIGSMDEFILENVAWTDTQIKKYYTYSQGRF